MLITRTENNAIAFKSTSNPFLDLFATIGSARGENIPEYVEQFMECMQIDQSMAIRLLLWTRDIREGAGAREVFRQIVARLSKEYPNLVTKMVTRGVFEHFGRWDDILTVFQSGSAELKSVVAQYIQAAINAGHPLCCKWMPRQGPIAAELRSMLGFSPKSWRKALVAGTNVVETKMCASEWDSIDFEKITSKNLSNYGNAFTKNASNNWYAYKSKAVKGEAKVKAGAIYPHEVVLNATLGDGEMANLQWNALPNFLVNVGNILPIIDVSGSMLYQVSGMVTAMMISVGLGIYTSERQQGFYKNKAITFSSEPEFFEISGDTISEKILNAYNANWGMDTDLAAVFDLILNMSITNNTPQEEMPESLLIISDMQFNQADRNGEDVSLYKYAEMKYREYGYKLPKIVFWNVCDRVRGTFPVISGTHTALISGFSPAILKTVFGVLEGTYSPEAVMVATLMNDRYDVLN